MSLVQWLRPRTRRSGERAPAQRQRPRPSGQPCRPGLELLEDRTLLSTSIPLNSTSWTLIGPAPVNNGGVPGNLAVSGRITGIAADPTNANIVYTAAAGGGVWKTANGGNTWTPLTDTQATLFMGSIALAPSNPSVIYAGTGEANNSGDSYYGRGVLKSTDAGATWTLLGTSQFDRRTIAQIVVDPTNANTVYVAVNAFATNGLGGNTGVWKSTDGGATWTNTTASISTTQEYSDLVIDPTNPQTLYAAVGTYFGANTNGVYKTTNGGASWAAAGNFTIGSSNGLIRLALARSSPQTLYASVTNPSTSGLLQMLKSTDGGTTWANTAGTPPNYMGGQGWYDSILAVDPTNPAIVYAGGSAGSNSVLESPDGGASWTDISVGASGNNGPHADHHALAFDAGGKLLDGDDGGIWRLSTPTLGSVQWTDVNGNLALTQFVGIALHPTNANLAFGGSQDNGTDKFNDALGWSAVRGGDGGFVRIDPATPATIYHEFSGISLERSDDGGVTWNPKTNGINTNGTDTSDFYVPYVLDPSMPTRLALGTNKVYLSTNRGDNWSAISSPNTAGWNTAASIDALAIARTDGNTIYATAGGKIFVTTNGGTSWVERDVPGFSDHFQSLLVDPRNKLVAYAVRDGFSTGPGGHVFRTTNGGFSWTDISAGLPNLPTFTIALDPRSGPGILYVGTDAGVYASSNGGDTWVRFGAGLPNVQVRELVIAPDVNVLAAGTHGRGTWEIALTNYLSPVGPVDISRANGNQSEASLALNPTNPSNLVAFSNDQGTGGVHVYVSNDAGATWSNRQIGNNDGLGVNACCDTQAAFDQFGNLFAVYIDFTGGAADAIKLLLSTNGGATFTLLSTLATSSSGALDQPSLAVGAGNVWVDWNNGGRMNARGAAVTGLGVVGAFTAVEAAPAPGGSFGNIAIGPAGQVLITYQQELSNVGPDNILVNLDADGLGSGGFGSSITVTATNVGDFDPIPPQPSRDIDAEANLAYDLSPGPHRGRVYLVYTDATAVGGKDTDIYVRFSDNDGTTWSPRVRVNDDTSGNSQFLPMIAVDQTTGNVAVAWYDSRNAGSADKTTQIFASISTDGGQTWLPNKQVSVGSSDVTASGVSSNIDYGDYFTMDFYNGVFYPIWSDNSSALANNPNLPKLDIATARVVVNPGPAVAQLAVTGFPASVTAGTAQPFAVTALDAFGNTATGYSGTVHFTSSDGQAALPGNSTLLNGTGTFTATLRTAGVQSVTATDTVNSAITGTTGPVVVTPAAATHLKVTAAASATAGTAILVTVTAQDAFNNTVTSYAGTVHFTSTDAQAVLPANATLTNGVGSFAVTFATAGNQTVTATDTATSSITGTTGTIAVSPATATHFAVGAPASATAGTAFNFTVTALDAFGNTATGYAGTVHFTSTDAQAALPANSTLTNGTGSFSTTLKTAGSQTLTATDTANSSITGSSGTITVSPAAATHFSVSAPATANAGSPFSFTVTALDAFNNTATGYSGTVHFTSSDGQASLPANSGLTTGAGSFQATLATGGNQTLTATDTASSSITGTSGPIAVGGALSIHFSVSTPASATAGTAFTFTVTALDANNNTIPGYAGTVHFTSTDAQASLPANSTLTNGVGSFSATLKTAGNQTLTATDTASSSITGTSAAIVVSAAAATHLTVSAPGSATAGTAFIFAVSALDAFNNTATGYTGTVQFTSGDPQAMLPVNSTLTGGTGSFVATLKTAGSQTLTATDTASSSLTGTSGAIAVSPAVAARFAVSAPATAAAGTAFSFTATALDAFGNTATSYTGTVHFSSSDGQATLPADSTLTNGSSSFNATLRTAGSQTLTASDTSGITGSSAAIAVSPAAATHFSVSAPATATAGTAFTFTVTALDAFNNTATGYAGTVHFSSSDGQAMVPANSNLTNGVGTFSATLLTAGTQTLTATDTASSSVTGTSGVVTVSPAAATHFGVSASPASITAGGSVTVTVTALDAFSNAATGYTGTVHFTSTDAQAVLPADSPLTGGSGSFSVTLETADTQRVTATDTATSSITGVSNLVAVSPAGLSRFVLTAPATATTGIPVTFSVLAADAFGNLVNSYAGTVRFSSSDTSAGLPANSPLSNGIGTFQATFNKSGSQTLTATDTANAGLTGSAAFAVRGLVVTAFGVTPTGFTVDFSKPFVNSGTSPINLYDAASAGYGAPDVTVVASDRSVVKGSLLVNGTNTGFTFVKTGGPVGGGTTGLLTPGTYFVALVSGPTAFKDTAGAPLDGANDGTNSSNYTTAFTVGALSGVAVTVVDFARGPDATHAINVPNTSTNGIPIALSNGSGVTDATLVLQYNTNLLTITGGVVNPALAGATFTVTTLGSGTGAQATIVFHSPTALASGAVRLGGLVATVPANAAYKSKELLHWLSLALNGATIPAVGDDGVHAVVFLGEASGDGVYTSADSVLISRVAAGADTGFATYPVLDPVIAADITGDGRVTAADATALNLYLAGTSVPQVPTWPGVPSNLPAGADPALSIPADLRGSPGGTVLVPINIDDPHPAGSRGLTQAVLALRYDPAVFDVSAADIRLGDVPAAAGGWTLQAVVDPLTGQIGIILFSATPISSPLGGSLVTIAFHVRRGTHPGASAVNLVPVVTVNGRVLYTALSDDQGPLSLHPAPTDAATDPGVDGLIVFGGFSRDGSDLAGTLLAVGGRASSPAAPPGHQVNPMALLGDGAAAERDWLQGIDPALFGGRRGWGTTPAARPVRSARGQSTVTAIAALEEYFAQATDGASQETRG
jgi:hypothetical protein